MVGKNNLQAESRNVKSFFPGPYALSANINTA